jgi:opacity protein-like surface antigen
MKAVLFALFMVLVTAPVAQAEDVYVNGYTRSDGTYVRPHIRSAPDSSLSNNYGSSTNDSQLMNPRTRDHDRDGTANYLDQDDDNDGAGDNWDSNQYGNPYGQ